MRKIILLALLLTGCSEPPIPCLSPNQKARVIEVQPTDKERTTVKMQVADGTTRVCGAWTFSTKTLKPGDVIVGYVGEVGEDFHSEWVRER